MSDSCLNLCGSLACCGRLCSRQCFGCLALALGPHRLYFRSGRRGIGLLFVPLICVLSHDAVHRLLGEHSLALNRSSQLSNRSAVRSFQLSSRSGACSCHCLRAFSLVLSAH